MTDILYVLLPNGRQQFLDANGDPLASGSVGMYTPGTLDAKETWQDPYGTTPNENPIPLDAAGSALIYGVGQYRQIVKKSDGSTLWDALTYGETPSGSGGATVGFGAQEDLASAPTSDLGSIATHNALITGNAEIANFGVSASLSAPIYFFEFDSTAKLIYDETQLMLPGATDFSAVPGDCGLAEYLGAGNWKVIALWPRNGTNFSGQKIVASASTLDLGAVGCNNVKITGSTRIDSFGASASLSLPIYLIEFTSTSTLTYNPATMILPGGADITPAAGDTAVMEYLGNGAWKMREYMQESGKALVVDQILQRSWAITANGAFDIELPLGITTETRIKFTLCGPGGGGGGCQTGNVGGGGGGGAGGFWQGIAYGFAPGQHITGLVGGIGGTGGTNAAGSNGNGPTQFSYNAINVVVCGAGFGGHIGNSANPNSGGAGGAVAVNFAGLTLESEFANESNGGFAGVYASSDVNVAGGGGSTPIGIGAPTNIFASGGTGFGGADGQGYGSGGSGAVGSTTATGGSGRGGFFSMELIST